MSPNITLPKALLVLNSCVLMNLFGIPKTVSAEPLLIFDCYRDPRTLVYSTVYTSRQGKKKALIYWKSNIIGNPKNNCRTVSDQFQAHWSSGKINYMKVGSSRKTGRLIICGLRYGNNSCNDQAKLFELLPGTIPEQAVKSLLAGLNDDGKSNPIIQSSDDEIIVDVRKLIERL
jgi:Circadian oscillating protein COP23